jgi:hypothetical protein
MLCRILVQVGTEDRFECAQHTLWQVILTRSAVIEQAKVMFHMFHMFQLNRWLGVLLLTSCLAGEMVGYDGKPFKTTSVAGALRAARNYNKSDKKITYDRLSRQLKQLRGILAKDVPRIREIEARCLGLLKTGTPRERKTAALCLEFTQNTFRLIQKPGMDSPGKVDRQIEDFRKAVAAGKKGG